MFSAFESSQKPTKKINKSARGSDCIGMSAGCLLVHKLQFFNSFNRKERKGKLAKNTKSSLYIFLCVLSEHFAFFAVKSCLYQRFPQHFHRVQRFSSRTIFYLVAATGARRSNNHIIVLFTYSRK